MEQAYGKAFDEVVTALAEGGTVLDCGASAGSSGSDFDGYRHAEAGWA